MKEYLAHPERFRLLGVVGVDGSPSCGVDYTSAGNWYGSFSGRKDLEQTLKGARLATGYGIFMDELCKMLREEAPGAANNRYISFCAGAGKMLVAAGRMIFPQIMKIG